MPIEDDIRQLREITQRQAQAHQAERAEALDDAARARARALADHFYSQELKEHETNAAESDTKRQKWYQKGMNAVQSVRSGQGGGMISAIAAAFGEAYYEIRDYRWTARIKELKKQGITAISLRHGRPDVNSAESRQYLEQMRQFYVQEMAHRRDPARNPRPATPNV